MVIVPSDLPIAVSSGVISGTFVLSNQDPNGTSMYTVHYSYPATLSLGTNFTIQIIVIIDQLSGLKTYLQDYGAIVTLNIDANHIPTKTVHVYPGNNFLYQGAHWGPVNISLPLDQQNTGVGIAQESKANVTVIFADDVWLGSPILNFAPESGRKVVGTVTILGQSQSGDYEQYVPYAAVVGGVALLLISVVLGRKGKHTRTSSPVSDSSANRGFFCP